MKGGSGAITFSPAVLSFTQQIGPGGLLSSATMSLLRELSQGNLSTRQLAARITQDPTLSASLLRLANSAYYGIPNRVSTVGHAVSLLGFTAIRNLIQGLCLSEFESNLSRSKDDSRNRSFSAHSMAVSKTAGLLTRKFGFPALGQGEAETAGLLHDIGFLLLSTTKAEQFQTLLWAYESRRGPGVEFPAEGKRLLDLERETFGFTHPELGAWLAQKWNLPQLIQEALLRHHSDLSGCLHRESVTVVQLANLLCNENEMGCLPEGFWGDVDPSILQFLSSQNKLETYLSFPHSIEREIGEIRRFHEMVLSGEKREPPAATPEKQEGQHRPLRVKTGNHNESKTGTGWMSLIPGLTHFHSGKREIGLALMSLFIAGLGVGIAAFMGGHGVIAFGALAAVGVSWGISSLWV